jgi:hypothetical protein
MQFLCRLLCSYGPCPLLHALGDQAADAESCGAQSFQRPVSVSGWLLSHSCKGTVMWAVNSLTQLRTTPEAAVAREVAFHSPEAPAGRALICLRN